MTPAPGGIPPPALVTVKGTPVIALMKFLEEQLTAEQRDRLLHSLTPDDRELFDRKLFLAVETYPLAAVNRLTTAAAGVKGMAGDEFARRAGRFAAEYALRGAMKFLAALLTPAALLERASRLWSSIYSAGELRVENREAKRAVLCLRNFPSERVGCARVTGWMEKLTELTRVKDVRANHVECVTRGASECRWDVSWT